MPPPKRLRLLPPIRLVLQVSRQHPSRHLASLPNQASFAETGSTCPKLIAFQAACLVTSCNLSAFSLLKTSVCPADPGSKGGFPNGGGFFNFSPASQPAPFQFGSTPLPIKANGVSRIASDAPAETADGDEHPREEPSEPVSFTTVPLTMHKVCPGKATPVLHPMKYSKLCHCAGCKD